VKTPIIVDNRGDVFLFESISDMERYIEPIDVVNQEYKFFDSTGRALTVGIQNDQGREKVKIMQCEDQPTHQSELRSLLITFLNAVSNTSTDFENLPLDHLIGKALPYKTD
jgi:hypothetical protein